MAIAFDAANSAQTTGASSLTVSVTVGASGSDRLLFSGSGHSSGTPESVSAYTYAGANLTQKWSFIANSFYRNNGYFKTAPATGANNLILTLTASDDELCLGGVSLTGVDQTTPLDTHATNSGTTTTATVNVSSATDDLVIDNVYQGDNGSGPTATIAVGAGQTSRWEQESIGGFTAGGQSTEPGAATTTMSWTLSNGSGNYFWSIGGVSINPAAAGFDAALMSAINTRSPIAIVKSRTAPSGMKPSKLINK